MTEFPTEKIAALHAHLKLRGGRMTTTAIGVAVIGRDMSPHTEGELQKILEAESNRLDIEPVSTPGEGLCWRRKEQESELQPAPTRNGTLRDWSLGGTIMQTAKLVARELGAEGVPPGREVLPTAELVRRLGQRLGESITPNAFAKSSTSMGGKWRNTLDNAYLTGRQEYLAKAESVKDAKATGEEPDAAPSILTPSGPLPEPDQPAPALTPAELVEEITELWEIACSSNGNGNGNGNGYHPAEPDEPTDEDLTILQEVEYLESELEESRREVESLQKRLEAAFAAVNAQTPQPAPQGTLQGVLDTLEAQLAQAKDQETEAEWRRKEAAAKVADLSEKLVAARQLVQVLEG